jgi:hypothetical protein
MESAKLVMFVNQALTLTLLQVIKDQSVIKGISVLLVRWHKSNAHLEHIMTRLLKHHVYHVLKDTTVRIKEPPLFKNALWEITAPLDQLEQPHANLEHLELQLSLQLKHSALIALKDTIVQNMV